MKPRHILAVFLALMLYFQPGVALATTRWSPQTYFKKYWPPSWSPPAASACGQSAIYDFRVNWNLAFTTNWIDHSCAGSDYYVGSQFLGTKANGYMDYSYCGTTGTYWNPYATHSMAVSAQLCGNPSGTQTYNTLGYSTFWEGTGWYYAPSLPSPVETY